jgi:hypothetical protein
MATYKVLQDIESEDKLIGPLTLKQFIFAVIFLGLGFISFTTLASSAPFIFKLVIVIILFFPMLVFGFLASPIGKDQPNEVWLLARLRFMFKPHKRIWNQDGISQLVTITAPKRQVQYYTDGLSQNEVKSRLHALANTMDSRGWAVKNVTTNLYAQPGYLSPGAGSDRLIDPSEFPQEVSSAFVQAADDMLDTTNNPIAQHLDRLVHASTQAHREQAITQMKPASSATQTPQDYWFMNQPSAPQAQQPQDYATFSNQSVVAPGTDDIHPAADENAEEKAVGVKLAAEHKDTISHITDHMKTLQPLHDRAGNLIPNPPAQQQPGGNTPNPALVGLAHNDDLSVATIARQAQKLKNGDDEVVISLH